MIRPVMQTSKAPRTSLQSFGSFRQNKGVNPIVQNRGVTPLRHPVTTPTVQTQARLASGNTPKVKIAASGAQNAAKRSSTLLNGLTPRLKQYGLSVNGGGKSGVIGSIKQSGRLGQLYRGRQR